MLKIFLGVLQHCFSVGKGAPFRYNGTDELALEVGESEEGAIFRHSDKEKIGFVHMNSHFVQARKSLDFFVLDGHWLTGFRQKREAVFVSRA